MSRFNLEMATDNDAFGDEPGLEIARLLRQAADRLEEGTPAGALIDANGNTVGSFEYNGLEDEQQRLRAEWDEAFTALRAEGLEHDADHPIAKRYRDASDAVNHANRKLEARRLAGVTTNYTPCPNHPGHSFHKSTGDCSCGSNHHRWASPWNPGGQK